MGAANGLSFIRLEQHVDILIRVTNLLPRLLKFRMCVAFERNTWASMVRADGSPTRTDTLPGSLDSATKAPAFNMAACSGLANDDAGIDVVRDAPEDAPDIINTDHYRVIEDLATHGDWTRMIEAIGLDEDSVRAAVADYVFILGPERLPNHHHTASILPHIAQARPK